MATNLSKGANEPLPSREGVTDIVDYGSIVEAIEAFDKAKFKFEEYAKWFEGQKINLQARRSRLETLVQEYVRGAYLESKVKTFEFPNGSKGGLRQKTEQCEITDMEKAVEWAKKNLKEEDLKVTVGKTVLKKHVKGTGEEVPGFALTPATKGDLGFSFKLKEEMD
jgi:hypothetical protein